MTRVSLTMDKHPLDELAERLSSALPSGLRAVQEDMKKTFARLLRNAFAEMDLVSREEFDVQSAVLSRTREKLEALEARVATLEERASGADPRSDD